MSGIHFHDHAHPQPHAHAAADLPSWAGRVDPRVKLVTVIALVVIAVSTPPAAFVATACYFSMLGLLLIWSRVSPHVVMTRVVAVVPFVALIAIFLPFLPAHGVTADDGFRLGFLRISASGLLVFWNVVWKALFGVLALTLLTWTTPFERIVVGLEQLRTPAVLVMLASFTYRYAFVLGDEIVRMRRARDSRGWEGRSLAQARTIGQMIGVFFLRSYERAERIHLAMLARGYEGRPTTVHVSAPRFVEVALGALVIGLFLVFRLGIRA
ncbi:MAG: cobalt ECF transporter T component CbiQ [bacterium]